MISETIPGNTNYKNVFFVNNKTDVCLGVLNQQR